MNACLKIVLVMTATALLALLSSCFKLDESLATAESAIKSFTNDRDAGDEQLDDQSADARISSVEDFAYAVNNDEPSVTLSWHVASAYSYSVVRSSNPDCDPLDAATCKDFLKLDAVSSPFTDADIQAGSTYFYWVLAQVSLIVSQESIQTFSAADADFIVSDRLKFALDFSDSIHGVDLQETAVVLFLDSVYVVRPSSDLVKVVWQSNPDIAVTVYTSLNADCNVLDSAADCANVFAADRPGDDAELRITKQSGLDNYFFWVHAKRSVPLLYNNEDQIASRLYGPMRAPYLAGTGTSEQTSNIQLHETTLFDEHSMSVIFPVPANLTHGAATYNFYIISGSVAAETALLSAMFTPETGTGMYSVDQLRMILASADSDLRLTHRSVSFNDLEPLPTGEMLFKLGDINTNTWYTVLLVATENSQLHMYQPVAGKTMQHMRVNAKGDNGLWRIRDRATRAIHMAQTGSGFYYPSTSDWRKLVIDAQLAFPDQQAYYFEGCAYYHDDPALGGKSRLFNNECQYAQVDTESGQISTVLSNPAPVTVVFERKANALACQNYQELPASGYRRSREYQLGAYETPICDHRVNTTDNSGRPNYFAMVYPHGEPTDIASGQVPQWYGGTQVPMYLGGPVPLPVLPDGIVTTTVCSDLGEDQRCAFSADINVVRCNGYYTYQLVQPTGCSVGYAWEESEISAMHRKMTEGSQ